MTIQDATQDFLEECRNAMSEEQKLSLAQTDQWAHVDKPQVHMDWDKLYLELAPMLDQAAPSSPSIQELMARHYAIVSRFYAPTRKAYIGMSLFYRENKDMRDFHNAYHPAMVDFLGDAMYCYAHRHL